jgi:hypothetical protein
MALRAAPVALAVAAALLAGCSSSPPPAASADGTEFDDLDLQASATTGVLRGIVVDQAIRPVANASVALAPGGLTTHTTAEGTFGFDGLEPGTYFVRASKLGYNGTQASADVVAGVAEPPIVKVLMAQNVATTPYVEALTFNGFLSFGAAVFATSVGTTVSPVTAQTLGDASIWTVKYTVLPEWAQGELVWDQNQPAGGELIWEMTDTSNTHYGYRETTVSPALAYWNTTVIEDRQESTLDPDRGIAYRFFGGPHPLCTDPLGATFGCGLTVQQRADAYVHSFYNFVPPEGWRFTKDGAPVVPS